MMKFDTLFQRIFFFILLGLILIGVGLVIHPFWKLIVLGAIVARLLYPMQQWLGRKTKLKRPVITGIIYVLVLLMIIIPILVGLTVIGNQAAQLAQIIESSDGGQLEQQINAFIKQIEQALDINLQDIANDINDWIRDNLILVLSGIATSISNSIGSAVSLFFGFVLFSFFFVVFLYYHKPIRNFFIQLSPFDPALSETYLRRVGLMTHDVMLGVFGVALIQTAIMWLTMVLVDIPFAGVLAIIMFFFALIPFLGMSLITIPMGIVLILLGHWLPALVIWLVHLIVLNNVDLILRPLITSKEVRVHMALLATGFLGGIPAFGLIGLFIGPILIILLTTSLELYSENYGQAPIVFSSKEMKGEST